MTSAMPPDDLDKVLVGMYEILRRHENLIFEVSVSAMALQELLENKPELAEQFQAIRQRLLKSEQLGPPHKFQLRLFDEIIARLRGT
jgi:hypothetical protein